VGVKRDEHESKREGMIEGNKKSSGAVSCCGNGRVSASLQYSDRKERKN
jgi:hypothetical protein